MALYVINGPVVIPYEGGEFYFTIKVDGNEYKDGKKVVKFSNINSSVSWILNVWLDDDTDNCYYFVGDCEETNRTTERYGYIYFDYELEDGTTGSDSIYVYQEGNSSVTVSCYNPYVMSADATFPELNVRVTYGQFSNASQIKAPIVNGGGGGLSVVEVAGSIINSNTYAKDYKVALMYHNVSDEPIYHRISFNGTNNNSFTRNCILHVTQRPTPFPFGLKRQRNGKDEVIPPVSSTNHLKMVTDIPFTGGTVTIYSYFPFIGTNIISRNFDAWDDGVATMQVNGGAPDQSYDAIEEIYTITFTENTTSSTRFADLTVEYLDTVGIIHTDKVRLRQNASDGSNMELGVATNVSVAKVKADGTPEMYDTYRIRYVGDCTPLTPTVNTFTMLGADDNTALVDEYGNYIVLDDITTFPTEYGIDNEPSTIDSYDYYDTEDPYNTWVHIGTPTVVEGAGTYNRLLEYPVTYDANNAPEVRRVMVVFGIEEDPDVYATVEVTQARYELDDIVVPEIPVEGDEYIGAIWKDVEYNFGLTDVVDYTIFDGNDNLIFKGRSCLRPNAKDNRILVNKICQNYMEIPELDDRVISFDGGYSTFYLKSGNGSTLYKTYKFVNDWSYTSDFKTGLLSHPILNDRSVVRGQRLPFSMFGAADSVSVQYGVMFKDNATDKYGEPIDDIYWTDSVLNGIRTVNFPNPRADENISQIMSYVIDGVEHPVVDCSTGYVLYYINPWGGYDWFVIKGKVDIVDELTQYTYTQNYNNTTYQFGKRRYLSEINRNYKMTTHWLKQDESDRMWYLLESNTVYLHNLKENKIMPVIIKDTSVEHKQKNRGNKIIQYQFTVTESQTRERI